MANERVVRQNNQFGTLGGSGLNGTDVTSTVTFSYAPGFETIGTNTYLKIILEPNSSNMEIVYLYAYTAAGTTGSIARGQEGTSTVAHPVNAIWQHGPTASDIVKNIDGPWGPNLGSDYEFDADDTTAIPSAFSWVNQGTSTYIEQFGSGAITSLNSASAHNASLIVQSLPTWGTWSTVTAKITAYLGSTSTYNYAGLVLRESASGKFYWVGMIGGNGYISYYFSTPTATASTQEGSTATPYSPPTTAYYRFTYVSSTSMTISVSYDGVAWWNIATAVNVTSNVTSLTQCGIIVNGNVGTANGTTVSCQWLRVR